MKLDEESKPVSSFIFWSVVSVFVVVFGYLFTEVAKVQSAQQAENDRYTSIQVSLSQVQTDLVWIKEKLSAK